MKIYAIVNQKGGVAKTTTTFNLGIGLARQGKKVLLIDADPQGSLTICMGYREPDSLEKTISTVITEMINNDTVDKDLALIHYNENVDLIPSNIDLSAVEASLVNVMSRETILRNYIDIVKDDYDYILIDCMPSLGIITVNALACADKVIIPAQAAYLSIKGFQALIKTINTVKRKLNPKLDILGILLTMVDRRTNIANMIIDEVNEAYGSVVPILKTEIPRSVMVEESIALGENIYNYKPNGKVAKAYEELTQEVLDSGN